MTTSRSATEPINAVRDNNWLANKMYHLWENHFADVPRQNLVLIKFGRGTRRQLGSIKWAHKNTRIKSLLGKKDLQQLHNSQDDQRITVITITKKFQDESIPDYVVESTIAHELCHYTHGFSSPLKQIYKHPHQGGLIRKEFAARGLGQLHSKAKRWIKDNWENYI